MPNSVDLKIRVLQFVEQGGGISRAAKYYQVGRATIYCWLGQTNLEPIKLKCRQRKPDWGALIPIQYEVEHNREWHLRG
jgi:transposase